MILLTVSEANRGIHADNPTGCQLIWVASARCPSYCNAPNTSWLGTCTELWQWFGVAVMAYGASTKLLYVGPGQYQ